MLCKGDPYWDALHTCCSHFARSAVIVILHSDTENDLKFELKQLNIGSERNVHHRLSCQYYFTQQLVLTLSSDIPVDRSCVRVHKYADVKQKPTYIAEGINVIA